ncbi:MAG: hypothetical protein AAGK01_13985, partial [Pseudomonadota bacterium]
MKAPAVGQSNWMEGLRAKMSSLYALAAPLALVLPLIGQSATIPVSLAGGEATISENDKSPDTEQSVKQTSASPAAVNTNPLNALRGSQIV